MVSLYWPFRGEPDLRPWMSAAIRAAGGGLPVVVEKAPAAGLPRLAPGDRLEKGVWNIPVPAGGAVVGPDMVISPLVGFDRGDYASAMAAASSTGRCRRWRASRW